MIRCIAALLDFAYIARRPSHDTHTLAAMADALQRFHDLRVIFIDSGVRPDGFSLPRQHALVHWVDMIKLFGSPNGVCTSIAESKHIHAVKRPWRASNRNKPLIQILRMNTRLRKLAAARVDFGRRGILDDDVVMHARRKVSHQFTIVGIDLIILDILQVGLAGQAPARDDHAANDVQDDDVADVNGPHVPTQIFLPTRPGESIMSLTLENPRLLTDGFLYAVYKKPISYTALMLHTPTLLELLRRYLREELFPGFDEPEDVVPLDVCPSLSPRTPLAVYRSARAVFYAPSELCGPEGMHSEMIRCAPAWFKQGPRYDTVLVRLSEGDSMGCMTVARVRAFLAFPYRITMRECALVEWFEIVGDCPDPVMNMWIVKPELHGNRRAVGLISVDTIVRACHLMPVFDKTKVPVTFHFSDTLDAFRRYYVNVYADYHAHELLK